MLILIDGRTPVAELVRRLPSLPDASHVLEALVRGGFVTVKQAPQVMVSVTRSNPPAAASGADAAMTPAVVPAPNEDVRHAVSELCRILHDSLGPDADVITVRVETARTRVEFAQSVRRGISLLQVIAGPTEANRFQARAQAILDTYFSR